MKNKIQAFFIALIPFCAVALLILTVYYELEKIVAKIVAVVFIIAMFYVVYRLALQAIEHDK